MKPIPKDAKVEVTDLGTRYEYKDRLTGQYVYHFIPHPKKKDNGENKNSKRNSDR